MSNENHVIPYDIEYSDDNFDLEQCRISAESGYAHAQAALEEFGY